MKARLDHPFCGYCVDALIDQMRIDGACLAMVRFLGWVYAEAAANYYGTRVGIPDRHRGLSVAVMNQVIRLAAYS